MKFVDWKGKTVPALGQGTWQMGDAGAQRAEEIRALQRGIDLGMTLIDTAEMYGNGRSEELVGEAVAERRHEVYLVSKVLPSHASASGTVKACEASLRRLRSERIDLYLLHWRGSYPLRETVDAMEGLRRDGKIIAWGVSNFDVGDMEDLLAIPGGENCATNQVLYNPEYRGIEFDLLPWSRSRSIPLMAYSPVGQGGALLRSPILQQIATRHGVSPAQVAIAWCLRQPVLAIPEAGSVKHVEQNAAAAGLNLSAKDLAAIDRAYPSPTKKIRLRTL